MQWIFSQTMMWMGRIGMAKWGKGVCTNETYSMYMYLRTYTMEMIEGKMKNLKENEHFILSQTNINNFE